VPLTVETHLVVVFSIYLLFCKFFLIMSAHFRDRRTHDEATCLNIATPNDLLRNGRHRPRRILKSFINRDLLVGGVGTVPPLIAIDFAWSRLNENNRKSGCRPKRIGNDVTVAVPTGTYSQGRISIGTETFAP